MGKDLTTKTFALMSCVRDIEFKLCPTEALSLLLEASLIRKYKPKYNVSLRDDKSFPLVKITDEEFPAVFITRKKESDGATYLGPYTSAKLLRQALRIIRRAVHYRTCKILPKKPCMYYRLNLCPGSCINKISKAEYERSLDNIILILEGKTDALINKLSFSMDKKSKQLDFEGAAKLRDQVNALSSIERSQAGFTSQVDIEDLKNLIHLNKAPYRIEAFDISNISGNEAVGSMVSFYYGKPDKNNYRKFRIKSVQGINDFAMIAEIVRRRYARLAKDRMAFPDLILIDGGKGHLSAGARELETLGLRIPLVSIAKKEEHIYTQSRSIPIKLDSDTPALNLIRRVRDEAHRFAVAYHHILRRKKIIGK